MQEEVDIVRIPEDQLRILRNVLGERIYFFYSDKLQVEPVGGSYVFWSNGFALALSTITQAPGKLRTYINISADYRTCPREASTYYEFEINVSNAPLWQEGSLQFGKLSSLKIFSDPILMIEIYQNCNKAGERGRLHDCAMVFYSQSSKYMLQARQELVGGVNIMLNDALIETRIKELKLRHTLV
ncbi:hypothetical protein DXT99_22785 [Pontibacter diazotrophicus]|uniref:Uncharacterized protein n=1 Tax=Pontibacter diazotrophicus TaxID=1400979 RepID=A0A3D8L5N1_9BACT|nr:hypothetical protein [Pontibacter diazotrophicus]RDV12593.1 hypothetical protein DXT99_22785 [Pontibacter diazotrophicus]